QPAAGCAGVAAVGPAVAAIADNAADRRTEIVATNREQVRAEIVVAGPCNRARADIAVPGRTGRVGEIDDAAGIGDELRVAAGAVVVELRERTVVRGDGCVGGGAVVVERQYGAGIVDDDGVAGRAGVVEVQIVIVDEAWRERGIVDDTSAVDVECDSRAARCEVKSGRPNSELDRIDRSV